MMLHDFGLNWLGVPPGYLLPSVIRSVNYLFVVRSLVEATMGLAAESVHGVDIGTGASAIFPILGCAMNPTWRFTATDVDVMALEWAQRNVDSCGLRDCVSLLEAAPGAPSLRNAVTPDVAFVMCNPPFFDKAAKLNSFARYLTTRENWNAHRVAGTPRCLASRRRPCHCLTILKMAVPALTESFL